MTEAEAANAYRLEMCRQMIEAICVVDPETGAEVPCYEPDPDKPGSYRQTEAYRRIEENVPHFRRAGADGRSRPSS